MNSFWCRTRVLGIQRESILSTNRKTVRRSCFDRYARPLCVSASVSPRCVHATHAHNRKTYAHTESRACVSGLTKIKARWTEREQARDLLTLTSFANRSGLARAVGRWRIKEESRSRCEIFVVAPDSKAREMPFEIRTAICFRPLIRFL